MPGQKKFTAGRKFKLIEKYLSGRTSVTSICQKAQISRKTFYQWLKKYKEKPHLGYHVLKVRRPKGRRHWRSISLYSQKLILDLVRNHPEYSVSKLVDNLPKDAQNKPIVSRFAVQKFLEKKNLNTYQKRLDFCQKPTLVKRLSPQKRQEAIERVLSGEQVSLVCQEYGLARKTFYKWLKRYLTSEKDKIIYSLSDHNPKGERHWKAIPQTIKEKIVDIVSQHPELSIHQIFAVLPKVEGKPLIGYYGLQKILEREGLNTLERRLEFARRRQAEIAPPFVPAPPPEIAPSRLRWILAPFATIPKKIWSTAPAKVFFAFFALFILWILEVDELIRSGMIFAIISLFFGLVFFLYAAKYYMSLALVLSFSAGKEEGEREREEGRIGRFLSRIASLLPKPKREPRISGLTASLEKVKLERYPFVSVHLPFYNEKKVAERILKACLSFEYPNYEVIVVDDSTDETTQICQEYAKKDQRIRLIHRDTRQGFKGGALQLALEQMNPKTEYICVFDADFIPFPDTLEQFVKTFQVLSTNDKRQTTNAEVNVAALDVSPSALDNPIAAVQGYQWHVLNKSENWITRGVRTEYAGSYVVERSGIEVYGGLKMIAGSVYMIRADVLRQLGWGTSITEDFELTLRLYEKGYKVVYTPYIQAPAECVSTIRRLIRQRMRWAEGHSHNVKLMFGRLLGSAGLTIREKLEFIYLAPYYLQAAFFMIGTISWFLAEVVFKVRLPFWSAALGWSLVFTNFISLPLMNIVGLFLEESEEKDYIGIASFILLSYILVPFQGYAAVKGLLEKEEGPWFRTPKTGVITDIIGRVRFYRWFEKLRIFSRPAPVNAMARWSNGQTANNLAMKQFNHGNFAFASSFNPLSGYKIKPKRISWVARGVIAGFLILAMFINYLALFPPPTKVEAVGTPKIEQQINIIDQEYSTTNTTFSPTDNSLGLINWNSAKFSDISAVYFEAVIKNSSAGSTTTVALFTSSGTEITGTGCQVSTTSASYNRQRTTTSFTSCTNYSDNTDYTVRIKASAGTAYIQAARLIILQQGAVDQSITKTQTQIEIGAVQSISTTSYTSLDDKKLYCYDGEIPSSPSSACSAASPSRWSPNPTVYFEATLKGGGAGDTGFNTSIHCLSSTDCKISYYDGTSADLKFVQCTSSDCSTHSTPQIVDSTGNVGRFTSIHCSSSTDCKISYYDYTNGDLKFVQCTSSDCSTHSTPQIVDSTGNVGRFTSIHCSSSTDCKISYYDYTNGDLKFVQCTSSDCSTHSTPQTIDEGSGWSSYAQLSGVSGSEVTTNSVSYTRVRSGPISLTAGTTYQVEVKVQGGTGYIANAKIILEQENGSGVSALETVQMYNNRKVGTQSSTYTSQNFLNQHTGANFSGTVTKAFESTLYSTYKKGVTTTSYAQLSNATGEVLTTSTTVTRIRSASVTPADSELDVQIKCVSSNGCSTDGVSTYSHDSWLIVQLQSIPVPESVIFALPGMIFLPRVVRWIQEKRKAKKRKNVGGRGRPRTRMLTNVKRMIANERTVLLIRRLSYG